MLTVQILTKNNSNTIQKTLDSVAFADVIRVADLGSTDDTIKICEATGAKVIRTRKARNEIRNELMGPEWNLMIEPWEVLIKSHSSIEPNSYYATIIQGKTISKEIRLWFGPNQFVNPVFERLNANTTKECGIVCYSSGRNDYNDLLIELENWKSREIYNSAPYYYHACILMALGKYEEFLKLSEHYMFMEPNSIEMSSVMNRYYYALVQTIYKKQYKPALQNLNLCLCYRPLMAEFWCLTGDVYYHLLKDFKAAKEFYENAIILGNKRLKSDCWPMDILKYKAYPIKMIDSCDKLLSNNHVFVVSN